MELVDVTPTRLQRRTGAVWLPWHDLAAQQRARDEQVRALAPGDDVMLRFEDGDVHRGTVLRNATAGDEGAGRRGAHLSGPRPRARRARRARRRRPWGARS